MKHSFGLVKLGSAERGFSQLILASNEKLPKKQMITDDIPFLHLSRLAQFRDVSSQNMIKMIC